jgi:hypothetical protein
MIHSGVQWFDLLEEVRRWVDPLFGRTVGISVKRDYEVSIARLLRNSR